MPSPLYEIVELTDGTVALRPADGEGEALVSIKLSDSASEYLGEDKLEVIKAMIEAGFEAAAEITEREYTTAGTEQQSSTLH
ncbi:MAG: hypothetical protein AseanaTS_24280 [Candidatus Pelagadaptatus aseana]|uniref:hypothetical protein n=1 Tax=Candidatus Pelagadaptatus aseana TaxID=3120508 RepID=UPI0039B23CE0